MVLFRYIFAIDLEIRRWSCHRKVKAVSCCLWLSSWPFFADYAGFGFLQKFEFLQIFNSAVYPLCYSLRLNELATRIIVFLGHRQGNSVPWKPFIFRGRHLSKSSRCLRLSGNFFRSSIMSPSIYFLTLLNIIWLFTTHNPIPLNENSSAHW